MFLNATITQFYLMLGGELITTSVDHLINATETWLAVTFGTGLMSQKSLNTVVPTRHHYCGVKHPGYFNQSHPSVEDGVKQMRIHYYRFYCSGDYGTALVRNCASFFVYKLLYLPFWDCDYGICTEYMSRSSFIM